MKRILRFIKFLIVDIVWEGLRFWLKIPKEVWREFNEKEKESK